MPNWGYSFTEEKYDTDRLAKGAGRDLRIKPKHAREVCAAIKGMKLALAKQYLMEVIKKKKPVPFKRHKKKVAHRHGFEKAFAGRYPVKAAAKILHVVEGAEANAENKGLDIERLRIFHAAAYPGIKIKRFTPRAHGRASPKNEVTTHIEIVLTEQPGQGEGF